MVTFVPMLTSIADPRRTPEILSSLGGTAGGKEIVDEHCAVRDETIVSDRDQLADEGVGLDSASLSDHDAALNFDEGPNEAIVADFATVEVDRLDDCDSAAESHVDDARLSNRGFCRYVFHG